MSWSGPFRYPGMVRFSVPGDGSCLIHSLLLAYDQSYRLERQNGRSVSRKDLASKFRQELANLLAAPIDTLDPTSPRYYDVIARGSLPTMSNEYPDYTLENMQRTLANSKECLDYMYLEFISDAIDKDIYILDGEKMDLLLTGEEDLYQKGRPSIVLHYYRNHYELVGIMNNEGVVRTLFHPEDDFIRQLKIRQAHISR